jgi:hypothetical protein
MRTIITLDKKPGLFRPHATVTVELEPWERGLFCSVLGLAFWVENIVSFYTLEGVQSFPPTEAEDLFGCLTRAYICWDKKHGKWTWDGFMPWKPGHLTIADYPELKRLAQHIQDKVSQILNVAMDSSGISEVEEVPPPEEYKKKVAAIKFAAMAKEDL